MVQVNEVPWVVGTFSENRAVTDQPQSNQGESVWPDALSLFRHGEWRPEELRTAEQPLGRVAMYGQCLENQSELDSALARAIEKNDPAELSHLPGSYTSLFFQADQVTALTDLAGQFPLYYQKDTDGIVRFSSLTAPLRGPTTKLDTLTLAAQIGTPFVYELTGGRSTFSAIQQVRAGHALQVNRKGQIVDSAYELFTNVPANTIEDAAHILGDSLVIATERRTRLGRFSSCDLSGGLDSTSIAFLAARVASPLLVGTQYSPDAPTEDLEHVQQYLALPESRDLFDWKEFRLPAAEYIYQDLLSLPPSDQPDPNIIHAARSRLYFQLLREYGSELHFTGDGGDVLFHMDPMSYLGELAHSRPYTVFWKSVKEAARLKRISPLALLSNVLQATQVGLPEDLYNLSRVLSSGQNPEQVSNKWFSVDGTALPWLTPEARKELSDLALSHGDEAKAHKVREAGNYATLSALRSLSPGYNGVMHLAAKSGLRQHNPYLDNNVIRACLSIPGHERVNPWIFKPLLSQALNGLVPNAVLQRNTKSGLSRQVYESLRAAEPVFEYLLKDSRLADLGIIEPGTIRSSLRRAYMGDELAFPAFTNILAGEVWLRGLDGELDFTPPNRKRTYPAPKHDVKASAEKPAVRLIEASAQYGVPSHIKIAVRSTGAAILDTQIGRYRQLNKDALLIINTLSTTTNFDEAIQALIKMHPEVDATKLHTTVSEAVHQLIDLGILQKGISTPLPFTNHGQANFGTQNDKLMARHTREKIKLSAAERIASLGGFVGMLALKHLPFSRQVAILTQIHEKWCNKTATMEEAERIHATSESLFDPYLGRMACLELSLTTVLAAAWRRQRINLVLGNKTEPNLPHAWPEVETGPETDGKPVLTANDEKITGSHQILLKV